MKLLDAIKKFKLFVLFQDLKILTMFESDLYNSKRNSIATSNLIVFLSAPPSYTVFRPKEGISSTCKHGFAKLLANHYR